MEIRKKMISEYINENNLGNSEIIDYKDEKYFDYYKLEDIPEGRALADSIFEDENGEMKFGFLKNFDGEEMRLITGYTGSGKSLRILLPQLLVAVKRGQSAIVTDTSGQLLDMSYKFLIDNNVNVRVLNFGNSKKSDRYNPLYKEALKCKKEKKVVKSAEEFVEQFSKLVIDTTDTKDITWVLGARSFFKGVTLGLFEEVVEGTIEPEDVTIYNIVQQCYWLNGEIIKSDTLLQLSDVDYYKNKSRFSKSIQHISPIAENAKMTRAGYLGIVNDHLEKINNSYIFDITSSNNFELSELWEKQTVIFINTADKSCGDMISSMMVNQLYVEALEESSKTVSKKLPRIIQIFLDEFANIKFCDKNHFTKMLTTTRKMQIFFNMFIQSYSQLTSKFDDYTANIVFSNCTQVFLGTNDYKSKKEFSDSCGTKLIESFNSFCNEDIPQLISVNLISSEELGKMPKGQMYVSRQGYDVIKTYFEGAYNIKQLTSKCTYEKYYKDRIDNYEENILLQPAMVKPISLEKWTKELLKKKFNYDELEEFMNIYKTKKSDNIVLLGKCCRYGILEKVGLNKYKPLLEKELVKEALERSKRTFDFDF